MSKISNAITMLQLLQSGRRYSVKELADELEVSQRMVRSYKEDFEKAGIYIDSIMGPYGGYVLNQNVKTPVKRFDKNDVNTLDEYINKEVDDKRKEELNILKDKINGIYLTSKESSKLNLTDENFKKYNLLTKAIKEKRKVKILYYSYGKGDNERIIDPAAMFLFGDGWYCAAFCERKHDIRHFELKRIKNCELLDDKYEN